MAQHPLKDGLHPSTITTSSPLAPWLSVSPSHSPSNLRPHWPGVGRPGSDITHDISDVRTTEDPLQDIPRNILQNLLEVQADNTTKIDLDVPHLRPLFYQSDGVLAVFLALFILLALVSAASNVSLLLLIVKQKLYKESLTLCLANMMVVHSVEVCVVLPLCVCSRLVQNWVLGEIVCYVLPVITDWPPHLLMLILLTGNLIRYGKLLFPSHSRPTAALLLPLCWVVSLLLVLPYLPHIQYRQLQLPGPRLTGGQLCLYEEDDYGQGRLVRGTFLLLLSVPVLTSLYLLCRVWWVLSTMERLGTRQAPDTTDQVSTTETNLSLENNNDESNTKLPNTARGQIISTEDRDFISQEKKTQLLLFSCLTVHVLCILPFNIFKLILPSLKQSLSSKTFDLLYIILLFISFLPCTSIPPLYVLWTRANEQTGSQASKTIFDRINSKKAIAEKEHQRRMSNMRMEELNRRHSTLGSQSPLKSSPGSPQVAGGENCLVVAVQQRRASIISISPENLLDPGASSSHSRSASVRSTHSSKHKQVRERDTAVRELQSLPGQSHNPQIILDNEHPGRRKSYAPTHYGRNSSFRYRDARSSPIKSRRHSIQPHPIRY